MVSYNSFMPHIHTGPRQHDLTVSAVIVRDATSNDPKVLLHLHKKLKKWMQFGGHVELGETPWAAIKHELFEETGYDFSQLKLLQPKKRISTLDKAVLHPTPLCVNTHETIADHFHTDLTYVFVTNEDARDEVAEGETDNMQLFTSDEIEKLETEANIKQICIFALEMLKDESYELVSPVLYSTNSRT
jgi:8-oxo-dGTP pyrophosphatase MutT (NUDIX family)